MKVHRRSLGSEILVDDVHEVPDMKWIPIDQVSGKLVDMSLHLRIPVRLRVRLAPAGDPCASRKLYVNKVFSDSRIPLDYFNIGDFQLIGSRVYYQGLLPGSIRRSSYFRSGILYPERPK